MKRMLILSIAAAFLGSAAAASAHEGYGGGEMMSKSEMSPKREWRAKMMGRHEMVGTVDSVDSKTGMLKVKTGEGDLMVHFPPASLKDLKAGDEITLHLGFSKNESKGGEMKAAPMK